MYMQANSKYAYIQNMHQDAEISISKYARICNTKYVDNMHNMHKWNMQNICLYASIYKNMQIPKKRLYAKIHMHIYAGNM